MDTTARLDLSVWRNDDTWEFPLRIVGLDGTNVPFAMQVRLMPDTSGPPLIDLLKITNGNAEGLRVAGVTVVDGVPITDLRIRLNKSTRQALPYAGEMGDSTPLSYALLIAGTTRLVGALTVLAHAYGSDNAPTARPAGYGSASVVAGVASGATLTISQDGGATLVIDGAGLVGAIADGAATQRQAAEAAALLANRYANANTDADIPNAAPGERGARFYAQQAATLLTRFTGIFPVFGPRSGVAWSVTDAARRKLLWIERSTAIFRVHLPTIFTRMVTLSGGAAISGRLGIVQSTLGAQPVDYPSNPGIRSGWLRAFTDSNRRVLFGLRRDMTVWAGGKRLLTTGDLGAVLPLSAKPEDGVATAYGDSLTAGSGETPYPLQLAGLIGGGFVATNRGMGSQKSTQIAMRAGAQPTYLTVQNNAIPAGANAVTVTAINGVAPAGFATANTPDYRLLSRADTNGSQSLTGYLAGIHGTLTRTASGGPPSTVEIYTFTPDAGTAGAACPTGTLFIPDDKDAVFRRELWVEIGRNNATDTQRIRDDVSAMVRHYRPTLRRILVFGVINSAAETRGTATWQSIVDLNNFLRTDHPSFFVTDAKGRDLRERLVATYDPAQAQDVTDFGNDVIATSLRRSGDPLHLNTAGYAIQAQLGSEFRTARFA